MKIARQRSEWQQTAAILQAIAATAGQQVDVEELMPEPLRITPPRRIGSLKGLFPGA